MQLQHFLSWNKANIKHNCKSQLYILVDTFVGNESIYSVGKK